MYGYDVARVYRITQVDRFGSRIGFVTANDLNVPPRSAFSESPCQNNCPLQSQAGLVRYSARPQYLAMHVERAVFLDGYGDFGAD